MAGRRTGLQILLIGQFLFGVLSTNRDDFILQTSVQCGNSENDVASIGIVTDLPVQVFALCSNGDFEFEKTDPSSSVHLHLNAHYSQTGADVCVFYKRKHTHTYVLHVKATIVEMTGAVRLYLDRSTVMCSFDVHGRNSSHGHRLTDSYLAPMEVQRNVGPESVSKVTLTVVDVAGDPVSNDSKLHIQKWIELVAVSDGAGQEAGVRTVSCDIVGVNDGIRYPFIRAGCGDGMVLPRTVGFNTTGLVAKSGLFSMVNVARDKLVKFACNFTLCNSSCDGSSCANERKRRSINDPPLIDEIETLASSYIRDNPTVSVLSASVNSAGVSSRDGLLQPTTVVLSLIHVKILLALAIIMALLAIGLPIFACVLGLRSNKVAPVA